MSPTSNRGRKRLCIANWTPIIAMQVFFMVAGTLFGGCGLGEPGARGAGRARYQHPGNASAYRFVGQPVVSGLGTGPYSNLDIHVVEVTFQLNHRLKGRTRGILAVNGAPNDDFEGYGRNRNCYSADIFLYSGKAAQVAAHPGDSVIVTLHTQRGKPPLRRTVVGHSTPSKQGLRRLLRATRCPSPPISDTHPALQVRSLGLALRAHLVCYGDPTDNNRSHPVGFDCRGVRHPGGALRIASGGYVQVRSRSAPYLSLTAPLLRTRGVLTVRNLTPRRVKGSRALWQARIPRNLHVKPNGLEVTLELPHDSFAIYALGIRIQSP